jgi:hypothetical protein
MLTSEVSAKEAIFTASRMPFQGTSMMGTSTDRRSKRAILATGDALQEAMRVLEDLYWWPAPRGRSCRSPARTGRDAPAPGDADVALGLEVEVEVEMQVHVGAAALGEGLHLVDDAGDGRLAGVQLRAARPAAPSRGMWTAGRVEVEAERVGLEPLEAGVTHFAAMGDDVGAVADRGAAGPAGDLLRPANTDVAAMRPVERDASCGSGC